MSHYKGVGGKKVTPKVLQSKKDGEFIPHAPVGRRLATIAERDLVEWREMLDLEFPLLSHEAISRAEQSFDMLLIHDMINSGHTAAAQEIHTLFRKEDRERARGRIKNKRSIRDQHSKLEKLSDSLKMCHKLFHQGDPEAAIELKKKLAETSVKDGDIWMAKHFLYSSLIVCRKLIDLYEADGRDNTQLPKMQAELHCLLAFLARETDETLETALAAAIDHLAICRQLSKGQHWQFKPKVLKIRLKKPIAIHGLRTAESEIYDVVDGCSLPIYMIATLLEHDLLISLANQIMHSHRSPTDEDVRVAHEFADHALKLAMEVRQPTAMSSALVRFGLVLRHSGAYEDALTYFEQLKHNAVVAGDYLSEAIAYHNIGLCLMGCHKSSEGLECFAKQLDLAMGFKAKDLEADAMYEIGHVFLQEGHMWEAEECYTICYEDFKSMEHTNSHSLAAWSMLAISAGHKLWGRFGNLCRHNKTSDYCVLLNWKCSRGELTSNHRTSYRATPITKAYAPYVKKMTPQPPPKTGSFDFEQLADSSEISSDSFKETKEKEKEKKAKKKDALPRVSQIPQTSPPIPLGEEDMERTELDVSQLDSDIQDRDSAELPGYARFNTKRVSSLPMIGDEMFIVVKKPSIPPEMIDVVDSFSDKKVKKNIREGVDSVKNGENEEEDDEGEEDDGSEEEEEEEDDGSEGDEEVEGEGNDEDNLEHEYPGENSDPEYAFEHGENSEEHHGQSNEGESNSNEERTKKSTTSESPESGTGGATVKKITKPENIRKSGQAKTDSSEGNNDSSGQNQSQSGDKKSMSGSTGTSGGEEDTNSPDLSTQRDPQDDSK